MLDMSPVRHLAVALATGLIVYLIRGALARTHARSATARGGTIAPNKIMVGLTTLGSFALGATALYAWARYSGGGAALGLGLSFVTLAALTVTALTQSFALTWDDEGVTGPASYGIPPFGPHLATIRFDEISSLGTDWLGSFFIENGGGDRVRWNYLYSGYPILSEAIADSRPELFDDAPAG